MRRTMLVILLFGAAVAVPGFAYAQTAPASDAEGIVLGIDLGDLPLLGVSETEAHAEQSVEDTTASASVLEVLGEPPLVELGGEQQGAGESSGAVLDTAGTALDAIGTVAVAPWKATVSEDDTGRHARARASVADVVLAPDGTPLLSLSLLRSVSEADHNGSISTSHAATDGVELILGDPANGGLTITILHSEASSTGGSSTYLIDINGTRIGSDTDDLGGALAQICGALTIPDLLELVCVRATGGFAEFVDATVVGGLVHGDIAQATASTGGAVGGGPVTGASSGPAGGGAPAAVQGSTVRDVAAPAAGGGELPRTGAALGGWAALGLALAAGSIALRRWVGAGGR